MSRIALIAVEAATFAIDKPFSYAFDQSLELFVGCRVLVPFGRGNKTSEGIVLSFSNADDISQLKEVILSLDDVPIIGENEIKLAFWMRQRYFCTFYDAIHTILPAYVWFQHKELWHVDTKSVSTDITLDESALLCFLSTKKVEYFSICQQFGRKTNPLLKSLSEKGYISKEIKTSSIVNDKIVRYVLLSSTQEQRDDFISHHKRSKRMVDALSFLEKEGKSSVADVCYFTGASLTSIKRLCELNLIEMLEQETYRITDFTAKKSLQDIILNDEQQTVFDELLADVHMGVPGVNLLYGITGSGKTQIYLKLALTLLAEHKDTMILVPEIALTPQMMELFVSYFGNEVALLHSGLRLSERYDQWKRIKRGEAHIVLGTRSAVFAPLSHLSLVVIDEEQESSYESETSPCYHARDIAKFRCSQNHARLVLGSATPTVASFYHATKGEYRLSKLTKRYNQLPLPKVYIADMREELRNNNTSSLSNLLKEEIQKNIEKKEQTILFLNRRGNAHQLLCPNCGSVPKCPRCSIGLTYHSKNHRMMCHYCGYSTPEIQKCTECGFELLHLGAGTQMIEEQLQECFPGVQVLRLDADSIGEGHEKVLKKFKEENIPILLGTQMVAKGLNFENVTLVGVLSADQSLYVDHYCASERTFNLITQVVGRAGRCTKEGRAVIQTFTPDNRVIQTAAIQNYDGFYQQEIEYREIHNDPPFYDLFTLTLIGPEEQITYKQALALKQSMDQRMQNVVLQILGPSQAPILKVNNKYRYQITVVCKNSREIREILGFYLKSFAKIKENKNIVLHIDCNKMN